jgi:hypothetical protein
MEAASARAAAPRSPALGAAVVPAALLPPAFSACATCEMVRGSGNSPSGCRSGASSLRRGERARSEAMAQQQSVGDSEKTMRAGTPAYLLPQVQHFGSCASDDPRRQPSTSTTTYHRAVASAYAAALAAARMASFPIPFFAFM